MERIYEDVVIAIDYEGVPSIVNLGVNLSADVDVVAEKLMSGEYKLTSVRPFNRSFSKSVLKESGYGFIERFRIKRVALADICKA